MMLYDCKKNKPCKVISISLENEMLKLRLYEIGLFPSSVVKVLKHSCLKNTMLVSVLDSCFVIKSDMAKMVEVEYE